LDSWSFYDTNALTSDLGYAPVSWTNLAVSNLGDGTNGNALVLDSTNAAWLQYNVVENDGTTNLWVGPQGSLMMWFAPNWSGTNMGGTGPQTWGRLIDVGTYTTNASIGWWSLYTCPAGDTLYFAAQADDGSQAIYLTAPVELTTNRWHHLALTYSATNCTLYVDALLVTNGLPLTIWPNGDALARGMFFGSDSTGTAQAHCWFDDISTYPYVLDAATISNVFRAQSLPFVGNPLNVLGNLQSAHWDPVFTPTLEAITGPGYFSPPVTNSSGCVTSSNVWLTNAVATITNQGGQQSVTLKFGVAGGQPGLKYDVFATSELASPLPSAQWAWMGQVYHCSTYTLTNLPVGAVYLLLGTPQDLDGDGITDAQELLITHTDPNNPDTFGTGMSDGWQLAYFGGFNVDFYSQCPSLDGWTIGQAFQNGWNPALAYTPPAPTGLAVYYYGPNTNVILQWNPSPGSVISYTIERALPGATTSYFTNYTTSFQDVLPSGYPDNGAPLYRIMASYPSGPSAWSAPVSIYSPDLHLDAKVVRGPHGNLYLVTGHMPPIIAGVRIWATTDPYTVYDNQYPTLPESNYLWETPGAFTNAASSGYLAVDSATLQSGFAPLPATLIGLYGDYDLKIQSVATDGRISDYQSITHYAQDDWNWQVGAIPFLDGRTQIQQNVEFQLRAAQGRSIVNIDGQTITNEVPFAIKQQACVNSSIKEFDEAAFVDYVTAGFHFYYSAPNIGIGWDIARFGLLLDVFRPFEQNYFYANFLPSQPWGTNPQDIVAPCVTSVSNTIWLPIVATCGGQTFQVNEPYIQFSVQNYVAAGGTNSVPSLLNTNAAQWIFLPDCWELDTFAGLESDLWDRSTLSPYTIYADFPNLYGLNFKSVKTVNFDPWAGPPGSFSVAYPGQTLDGTNRPYFFEVERPQLKTVDYYFARSQVVWTPSPDGAGGTLWTATNLDVRPGEPNFTTAATTPLIITPFGQPLFMNAWAKQAITNGFKNVFAYPEQYFDQAYTIDQNGQVATNSAGILSPYGEFLPTMPGPIALVTMPDAATGSTGTGIVNVIKLQLDVNHDAVMDLTLGGPDNTATNRPFFFWANNDYDRWLKDSDDNTNYQDSATGSNSDSWSPDSPWKAVPDYEYRDNSGYVGNRIIPCARDLEDFARLWVCGITTNLLTTLPPGTTITLSWGDVGNPNPANPTIDLFPAADADGGMGYLTNAAIAARQIAPPPPPWLTNQVWPCPYVGRLGPGQSIQLNSSQFTNGWAGNYFIWCGVSNGVGQLALTISQGGTNTLGQTTAYIQITDIKQMYERWTIGDRPNFAPTNVAQVAQEDITQPFQYSLPTDTNTTYILYVHGWNMNRYDKDRFAERAFKRLYWQGYQGRFGVFRWPTEYNFKATFIDAMFQPHNYDGSELNAWKSATGLLNKLNDLNAEYPGHVYLLAHSMGSVVAGEALRLAAQKGLGQLVNTYVASQAAIPAHVYDATVTSPYLIDYAHSAHYIPAPGHPKTPNIYGNRLTNTVSAVGRRINFYNGNDYALNADAWCFDQELKPDTFVGSGFYFYSGTTNDPSPWNHFEYIFTSGDPPPSPTALDIVNNLSDRYEALAYAANPYSTALGATPGIIPFDQNLNLQTLWPPDTVHLNHPFDEHFYHSAQFRGDYWQEQGYWHTLLYSPTYGFNISNP
jgi:hypothetical protein